MRITKKLISFFLVLAILAGMVPTMAFAANDDNIVTYAVEGGSLYFNTETGTITDCDTTVTKAVIPEEIDGVNVTSIGSAAFSGCKGLSSISIPDGVTSIGSTAFSGCSKLTSISIPDGVTSIEYYAFSGCSSLTSISIPDGVTSIEYYAFSGCSSLTSISIPDSVTSIGSAAFSGCSSLIRIDVGAENVKYCSVDGVLFNKDKTRLLIYPKGKTDTTYTIPDGVTSVEDSIFSDCSKLTSISIPDGVTSIGDNAFSGCSSLTSINIPDGVTYIGDRAFDGCSSLSSISIPDGVTSIGSTAFSGCSKLTSISIPDSVTSIEYYAFSGCSSLTSISIPDSVTSIGSAAFSGCSSLTSISIPDSVTSIEYYAFSGCSSLTSISIPDSVTSIGHGAFSGCSSLTSIYIPNSVTSIENNAFESCYNLKHVYYSGSKSEWEAISGEGKPSGKGITIHYNSTGLGDAGDTEQVYVISLNPNGGTMSSDISSVMTNKDGKLDTLPRQPRYSGYSFDGWYDANGNQVTTSTIFTEDTTIYAHWTYDAPSGGGGGGGGGSSVSENHPISVPSQPENGSVSFSTKSAAAGDTVTLTVQPDAGYVLDKLTVTDTHGNAITLKDNGNGAYSFTMPNGDISVAASFRKAGTSAFRDVPTEAYFAQAVQWTVDHNITTGTDEDTFSPEENCTRAQIVTFLWRAAGSPVVNYAMDMTDVPEDAYYAEAVRWALREGITTGTTATTFSPDETCVRAQSVTFLHRYGNTPDADGAASFPDVAADSWYEAAVRWAVANNITTGTSETTFSPDDDCTRAQIVTFLYRMLAK